MYVLAHIEACCPRLLDHGLSSTGTETFCEMVFQQNLCWRRCCYNMLTCILHITATSILRIHKNHTVAVWDVELPSVGPTNRRPFFQLLHSSSASRFWRSAQRWEERPLESSCVWRGADLGCIIAVLILLNDHELCHFISLYFDRHGYIYILYI